ncbi:MAG TPA: hypothetical protein PKD05_11435 [Candidatus Melainabacteria bacterium]|nr:hypothetical protein [Candidatus Melainabacteria bacterium]
MFAKLRDGDYMVFFTSRTRRNLLSVTVAFFAIALTQGCQQAQMAGSYDGAAKNLAVKANMQRVQAAAEAYFRDHTYMYPAEINDDFKSYFPGGDPASKKPGSALTNPFTGQPEWPVIGTITDLTTARAGLPKALSKGVIEYSPINGGKSYAVRAGGFDDKEIPQMNSNSPLVLSRDNFEKSGL